MQDNELLKELLEADDEAAAIAALNKRGLLQAPDRWRYVGNMPNNQSVVHAQQSSPSAALVEKFTNALDAILLRQCKAKGIDPRGPNAPASMGKAVETFFGDMVGWGDPQIRKFAEENMVLYATGSKARPCIALYDAGEGQLPENFPSTFCSLIYGSNQGSYKGAIPFVQGRFNMGGTGVLPFCSEKFKLQLVVSRVPADVAKTSDHEWGYTLFCFFPSKQDPSWKYLLASDGHILTAGNKPLGLVPKVGAKSGEVCPPRERAVASGTLVKMFDYQAPRSNVCGELFRKLQEYLLRPALPLRIIECRDAYKAKVMGVNVWDRLSAWGKDKFEPGFEEGASVSIVLETGETIPAEIRVYKAQEVDIQTGLRALINGQSHARRDAQFFRTRAVDKEHIAGSMLVMLDCTDLGQASRNALFMSNREIFREDPLLNELFKKLQKELHDHEGLEGLNLKRYEEKVKDAVDDEHGIKALEELLATDPTLAELFGSMAQGKVAAKTATNSIHGKLPGAPQPFHGLEYPTYIYRRDKSTTVHVDVPIGDVARVSFITDVKNNYFTRHKHRGFCMFTGEFEPTYRLFNGKLTFTCAVDKELEVGTTLSTVAVVTDKKGSGPFKLTFHATVAPKRQPKEDNGSEKPYTPPTPKVEATPSRPNITEADKGAEKPPLTIEKDPKTSLLQLVLNTTNALLMEAKGKLPKEEEAAVAFVFKYGLALVAMGLLETAKKSEQWKQDEAGCRKRIEETTTGVARVIVPLCLSLPKKLPKP
jgi:hypothetical protein